MNTLAAVLSVTCLAIGLALLYRAYPRVERWLMWQRVRRHRLRRMG